MRIDCICPPDGTRHPDGDTVNLRERLDFRAALTARNTIILLKQEDADTAAIMAALTEMYLLLGIESWTVTDAKGRHVEPNKATIAEYLFSHPDTAMTVGDAADELYSDAVISPLVARASTSSQDGPTPGSTSAGNGSRPKPPKPSRPSSITTSPMDGIAATT